MSAPCEVTAKRAARVPMNAFERYLTLWVFLCIVAGIAFGQVLPGFFQAIGRLDPVGRSLALLYLEGYSHQETAEILGLTETNVSTRLNRMTTSSSRSSSVTTRPWASTRW